MIIALAFYSHDDITKLKELGVIVRIKDVRRIIQVLLSVEDLATIKTADFALDLVRSFEGKFPIRYILFKRCPW